ncbi:MAG: GAF domain-containing protein [Alphaproteobacteria bacterium]|nr:GAF domain-containing protein [Alphaproteobacteria bacterium]
MKDVVPASLTQDPWPEVARAVQAACDSADAEAALRECVETTLRITGQTGAENRPGALKSGETQYFVGGVFLAAPDGASHLLVAEWGFPPEQHRLHFPLDTGHPGWIWKNRQPLLLENTDEHSEFKQILRTSRMGSAMYAPMLWDGQFIGQIITAAQARNTYSPPDRDRIAAMASIAAGLYLAKDGPAWLAQTWQGATQQ